MTSAAELTLDELTKFGIQPEDEGTHPYSPEHEWWNESWFLDWFADDARRAGHVRIGLHPNQDRAWLWCLAYEDGEWLVLEETRLLLGDVDTDTLSYDKWGLSFTWERTDPLRRGRLRVNGYGRVVTGPRAGLVLPVAVDLAYETAGAAHSTGPSDVAGHADLSGKYQACRFEQAVSLEGEFGIGTATPFVGKGERDHSWGPRDWNIEWTFCVAGNDDFRMQWATVDLPGMDRIGAGYLHRDTTMNLTDVQQQLEFRDDDLVSPVQGPFTVTAEDGATMSGRLEPVAGVEIDLAHTFVPPRPTVYRRTLVRLHRDDGGAPALGWLESNRFVRSFD